VAAVMVVILVLPAFPLVSGSMSHLRPSDRAGNPTSATASQP